SSPCTSSGSGGGRCPWSTRATATGGWRSSTRSSPSAARRGPPPRCGRSPGPTSPGAGRPGWCATPCRRWSGATPTSSRSSTTTTGSSASSPPATCCGWTRSSSARACADRAGRAPGPGATRGAPGTCRCPVGLDREQVAGAGVGRRVPQLRHRPRLDLADALAGEVEVLAHLLERPRLAPVEAEAQLEDLALALVERGEEPVDLLGQQGRRGHL